MTILPFQFAALTIAATLAFFGFPGAGHASEWELISKDDGTNFFLNRQAGDQKGVLRTFWLLAEPAANGLDQPSSTLTLQEADCSGGSFRILLIRTYSSPMATGDLVKEIKATKIWVIARPHTRADKILKHVCAEVT